MRHLGAQQGDACGNKKALRHHQREPGFRAAHKGNEEDRQRAEEHDQLRSAASSEVKIEIEGETDQYRENQGIAVKVSREEKAEPKNDSNGQQHDD